MVVILDSFAHKVVGGKLDRTSTSRLAPQVLQQAITASDKAAIADIGASLRSAIQHAAAEYVAIIRAIGAIQFKVPKDWPAFCLTRSIPRLLSSAH